jgi:protein-tyrosine phosphatase
MLDLELSGMFTARQRPTATIDVLFVCTGNICRSPMAAQLLRTRTRDLDVAVESSGTYGQVGEKMDRRAAQLAVELGVPKAETRDHRARWMTDFHLAGTDLVLTMTADQLSRVRSMAPDSAEIAFTVREFERLAADIPDDDFREAADAAGGETHHRLRAALQLVTARRTRGAQHDDDVVDPHRQPAAVFRQAADEMLPGIDAVARMLRATLT